MLTWFAENMGSMVVLLTLLAVVFRIVSGMVKNRRRGGNASCGCDCSRCGMCGTCHGEKKA